MFDWFKRLLPPPIDDRIRKAIREHAVVNSAGFDQWGLHLDTAEKAMRWAQLAYDYFRVEVHNIGRVPAGRALIVPNHSGQLPLDGMVVATAMVFEADPPRIVRGMIERWFPSVPFVSTLMTRCGQVVGDPDNCRDLLVSDQTILVFPEGVRGSGKTYWNRYQLQRFGTGFIRLALECNAPIIPTAVVGAEETYPAIFNLERLAKWMGTPYAPITPFFPALGLLGTVPLPVKIDVFFGEPIMFEGDHETSDDAVLEMVEQVKGVIEDMLRMGVSARPGLKRMNTFAGGPR